jgi:hypothetical protein
MPYSVSTTITLRTPRGVIDLALREADTDTLVAEGEHDLRAGKRAEFQFALPGANANLRGIVEITKVVKLAVSPTRTVLNIVEMNSNDAGILREWAGAQLDAMASRLPRKKPPPPSIEEIRGMRSGSLASSLGDPEAGVGREALTQAITADPNRPRGRRSSVRRGVEDSRGPGSGPRKRKRVEVKVASSAQPPIVMIRFNDPERYVAYYWKHLHRSVLQVRFEDAELEKGAEVSVRVVLPGGSTVKCSGAVRVITPTGFGLQLQLADRQRSTLRLAAGPKPRDV